MKKPRPLSAGFHQLPRLGVATSPAFRIAGCVLVGSSLPPPQAARAALIDSAMTSWIDFKTTSSGMAATLGSGRPDVFIQMNDGKVPARKVKPVDAVVARLPR